MNKDTNELQRDAKMAKYGTNITTEMSKKQQQNEMQKRQNDGKVMLNNYMEHIHET